MCADWEEWFCRMHPLNLKIEDTDLFLHATSSKKYLAIKQTGSLLRDVPVRNWGISRKGICFEKYVEQGQSCHTVDLSVDHYCEITCKKDGSSEGVVLQINGRELKKLDCSIYADCNKNCTLKYDCKGIPIDVDSDVELLSIVVDGDIPLRYLKIRKKVSLKANHPIDK